MQDNLSPSVFISVHESQYKHLLTLLTLLYNNIIQDLD